MPPCRSTSVKVLMAAPSSAASRRISAWAPALRASRINPSGGILGQLAIERRRAERAVGIGADQRGKRDFVGAPHRDHGQQADQARRAVGRRRSVAPCGERRDAGAAPRRGVHRQFPVGQIIAVRLIGAFGERAPLARGHRRERRKAGASARSRRRLRPLRRDHRSATDHRSISYLDHVPVSPFAMIEASALALASCIALTGTLSGKDWKNPPARRCNLSGGVNGPFAIRRGAGAPPTPNRSL